MGTAKYFKRIWQWNEKEALGGTTAHPTSVPGKGFRMPDHQLPLKEQG